MNKILLAILFTGIVLFISACKDDNPVDPGGPVVGAGYFPNTEDSYYKYAVSTRDNDSTTNGTRTTNYRGVQVVSGTSYQVQIDSTITGGETSVTTSLFRKSDTGVFYFLDTTGLGANIEDSLEQYISSDIEVRTLAFPLTDGTNWTAYRLNLNYGPLVFSPVEVAASFVGKENVTLSLNSGEQVKNAIKIRYVLKLKFDVGVPSKDYEAYSWLVDGIGVVKWEGRAAVINGISGNGINFADTTKVITQSLIDYNIK